jgi:hypothetical protein
MNILVNSFNTGEISRLAEHRVDQPRRHSGVTRMRNMLPRVFGGAMSRPGTEYLGGAKTTGATILIPFAFSTTTAYMIEAGAGYMRFWNQDGTPVEADGAPFEVITPYTQDDLPRLRYAQANDIMYLVHPAHPVAKLVRVAEDNWTYSAVDFGADGNWPPMENINAEDITITPTQNPAANGVLWKYWKWTGTKTPSDVRAHFRAGNAATASGTATVPALGMYGSEDTTQFGYYVETWVKTTVTGTHLFRSTSDGGSALWINGTQVFNNSAAGTHSGSISLTPGFHKVELVFTDNTAPKAWAAATAFQWQPPGAGSYVQVPAGSQYQGFLDTAALVANADVFQAGHVGSFWMVGHDRTSSAEKLDLSSTGTSNTMRILGDWSLSTVGTWHGTLLVQRSEDGSTNWQTIRSFQSLDGAARNVNVSGREERESYLRLNFTDGPGSPASSPNAVLEAADPVIYSLLRITAVADAQNATAEIINGLYASTATSNWAEGSWSNVRGFPSAVTFHEQRLTLAGGQRIWASVIGDWENFRLTTLDDSALDILLGSTQSHAIQWIRSFSGALAAGTNADEWIIDPGESGSTLTPTTIRQRMVSSAGSGDVPAIIANDVILFLQRNGRKWRELVYSLEKDGYVSPDMNLLSEHVLGEGVRCAALQRQDDTILWCVRTDGLLASMSYDRQQEFAAWATHDTRGGLDSFQWTAVLPGGDNEPDQVWFVVEREIKSGGPVMMIERFHPESMIWTTAADPAPCNLDCATVAENPVVLTGLDRFSLTFPTPPGSLPEGWVHPWKATLVQDHITVFLAGVLPPFGAGADIDLTGLGLELAVVGFPIHWSVRPVFPHVDLNDGTSRGRAARINAKTLYYDRSIRATVSMYRGDSRIRAQDHALWRITQGLSFQYPGWPDESIPAIADGEMIWTGPRTASSLDGKWKLTGDSGPNTPWVPWALTYHPTPSTIKSAATSTKLVDFPGQADWMIDSVPSPSISFVAGNVRANADIWHTGALELFQDAGISDEIPMVEISSAGPYPMHLNAIIWKLEFYGQ